MIINYSDQEEKKKKKSIFLAGPTPRGENTESWRTNACNILEQFLFLSYNTKILSKLKIKKTNVLF